MKLKTSSSATIPTELPAQGLSYKTTKHTHEKVNTVYWKLKKCIINRNIKLKSFFRSPHQIIFVPNNNCYRTTNEYKSALNNPAFWTRFISTYQTAATLKPNTDHIDTFYNLCIFICRRNLYFFY